VLWACACACGFVAKVPVVFHAGFGICGEEFKKVGLATDGIFHRKAQSRDDPDIADGMGCRTAILPNSKDKVAFGLVHPEWYFLFVEPHSVNNCIATENPGKPGKGYVGIPNIGGIEVVAIAFLVVDRKADFWDFVESDIKRGIGCT
jgi:hypothetical protein